MQISERDNFTARFWENFTSSIAPYSQRFSDRLLAVGFPETDERFAKYRSILEDEININEKYIRVFDDFHLIKNRSVLRIIEKIISIPLPKVTTILISRSEPDINTVTLLSKGLVTNISEEDLKFTEDETAKYFEFIGVSLSSQSVASVHSDTGGWPFAESLVGLSLKKAPTHENVASAAMKLNIFKMIESEVYSVISEPLKRFLAKLSLVEFLATDLVDILAGDAALVEEMKEINAFIRYDMFINAYLIQHLFLDFIKQRQDILTEEEKRDTYLKAAAWCAENHHLMDAIAYYDKAGDYMAISKIVYTFPLQIPYNRAQYILDIYDGAPKEIIENIPSYFVQRSRLFLSIGKYEQSIEEMKSRVEKFSALPPSDFNNRVLCGDYEALGVTSYLISPYTDRFDFDKFFKKADYYYSLSPYEEYGPVTSISMSAWVSKVPIAREGAMEEYIGALSRTIPHFSHVLNGAMSGLDTLAKGELLFYKSCIKSAERESLSAYSEAGKNSQFEIKNRALFYLLRIAVAQGDFTKVQSLFKDLDGQLEEKNFHSRYITFDIVSSWFYLTIGQTQSVASWLRDNFTVIDDNIPAFDVIFGNFIKAKLYYVDKRYYELLSFLDKEHYLTTVLFGKLEVKILQAACYYQLKDRDRAFAAFKQAYELSKPYELDMPFIELGKDMRTLTGAALKKADSGIPRAWLQLINRKSATYAKRQAFVLSEYKKAFNLDNSKTLSPREMNVLQDLYHGLSRSEVAVNQNLSINTVKMLINSIYRKLEADSAAELIRIAVEQQLLK
jgi:LuxR family maltose regulon positive regulatory protein